MMIRLSNAMLLLTDVTEFCVERPLSRPCEHGGYQDPNDCSRCLCPDGFAGDFCTDLEPAQGGRSLTLSCAFITHYSWYIVAYNCENTVWFILIIFNDAKLFPSWDIWPGKRKHARVYKLHVSIAAERPVTIHINQRLWIYHSFY